MSKVLQLFLEKDTPSYRTKSGRVLGTGAGSAYGSVLGGTVGSLSALIAKKGDDELSDKELNREKVRRILKRTLIGSAVGGALGAGAGYYGGGKMDEKHENYGWEVKPSSGRVNSESVVSNIICTLKEKKEDSRGDYVDVASTAGAGALVGSGIGAMGGVAKTYLKYLKDKKLRDELADDVMTNSGDNAPIKKSMHKYQSDSIKNVLGGALIGGVAGGGIGYGTAKHDNKQMYKLPKKVF